MQHVTQRAAGSQAAGAHVAPRPHSAQTPRPARLDTPPIALPSLSRPSSQQGDGPAQLTRRIKTARTWEQAFEVFLRHSDVFNAINTSALVHRMAQLVTTERRYLSTSDRQELRSAVRELHYFAESEVQHMRARELCNTTHGLAKLGALTRRFVELVVARVTPSEINNTELCALLWALAHSGQRPTDVRWMASMAVEVLKRRESLACKELATSLWALAKLSFHPGQGALDRLMIEAGSRVGTLVPLDYSNLLWAFATLSYRPTPSDRAADALQALLRGAAACAAHTSTRNCSLMLWSVGTGGWSVPEGWVECVIDGLGHREWQHTRERTDKDTPAASPITAPTGSSSDTDTVTAARNNVVPYKAPDPMRCAMANTVQTAECAPQAEAVASDNSSNRGAVEQGTVRDTSGRDAHQQHHDNTVAGGSTAPSGCGLVGLGVAGGPEAALRAVKGRAGQDTQPGSGCTPAHGLVGSEVAVGAVEGDQGQDMPQPVLSDSIETGDWRWRWRVRWRAECGISSHDASLALQGLAMLQYHRAPEVLDGLISQVLDAPELTSGHMSDDTSEWVWDGPVCAVDTDGATGPQDLTSCLWAAAHLGHVLSPAQLSTVWRMRLATLQAEQVASTATSLAHMRVKPPRSWLMALLRHILRTPDAWGPREVASVMWALARMHLHISPNTVRLLLDMVLHPDPHPHPTTPAHRRHTERGAQAPAWAPKQPASAVCVAMALYAVPWLLPPGKRYDFSRHNDSLLRAAEQYMVGSFSRRTEAYSALSDSGTDCESDGPATSCAGQEEPSGGPSGVQWQTGQGVGDQGIAGQGGDRVRCVRGRGVTGHDCVRGQGVTGHDCVRRQGVTGHDCVRGQGGEWGASELLQVAQGFAGVRHRPTVEWLQRHQQMVAREWESMNTAQRERLVRCYLVLGRGRALGVCALRDRLCSDEQRVEVDRMASSVLAEMQARRLVKMDAAL